MYTYLQQPLSVNQTSYKFAGLKQSMSVHSSSKVEFFRSVLPKSLSSPSALRRPLLKAQVIVAPGDQVQTQKRAFKRAVQTESLASAHKQSVLGKMTHRLLQTFQDIEQRRHSQRPALSDDLPIGHIVYPPNEKQYYKVLSRIGTGANSSVYKVERMRRCSFTRAWADVLSESKQDGVVQFALKVSVEDKWNQKCQSDEERFITRCSAYHDHVVIKMVEGFSIGDRRCTILEALWQDLWTYMLYKNPTREARLGMIQIWGRQLALALVHLASHRILHGDIKLQNILMVDRQHIRLADFGLSQAITRNQMNSYIQSPWYRAPEVAMELSFNEKADMWSLGCIFAELYIGQPLFEVPLEEQPWTENENIILHIARTIGAIPDILLDQSVVSQNAKFIRQLERCTKSSLKTQIFGEMDLEECSLQARSFFDLLTKMLAMDPNQRISARDLVRDPFFSLH